MKRKPYKKKEYAVYRGDKFLMIGTVPQIAKEIGIRESSVYRIACEVKQEIKETRYDEKLIIIPLEDEGINDKLL